MWLKVKEGQGKGGECHKKENRSAYSVSFSFFV